MISLPLFRREARRSIALFVIFAGILALYASVILTMYDPELGESLAMMKDAMPQLFAAFGMSDPGPTPSISMASRLAKWVRFRGSCAGHSAPVQRRKAPSSSRTTGAPHTGHTVGM